MWALTLRESPYKEALFAVLIVLGLPLLYHTLWQGLVLRLWWRPWRIRHVFEAQGVKCLPRPFPYGNVREFLDISKAALSQPMPQISHDIAPRILPHLFQWTEVYGKSFVYWFGSEARYTLTEPEQAKEVLSSKSGHYEKFFDRPDLAKDLAGDGLVLLEGEKWAQHRRIMNPAFYLEKLKAMAPIMARCTATVMENWKDRAEKREAIDVFEEFRNLTADIIAHTAFGSSFREGKQVFELQHEQQILIARMFTRPYIPGSMFLPTAENRYLKKINNKIVEVLGQLIQKRMESYNVSSGDSFGNDLLGLMMAANRRELQGNQKNLSMGIDEIVEECKTFFFSGHESTATLLTWTLLLLGSNPEWQERVRKEVYEVCGRTEQPTAESVNQLKLVAMVINEALRLYPPAVVMTRRAVTDVKLVDVLIPAETVVLIPIIAWHHDKRFWGSDATEFRPDRFSEGALNACSVPGAYLPFSIGPRSCIGQVFALLEAKIVLCSILQRYRFQVSSTYCHAPTLVLTMQPQFGMPIIFENLE